MIYPQSSIDQITRGGEKKTKGTEKPHSAPSREVPLVSVFPLSRGTRGGEVEGSVLARLH